MKLRGLLIDQGSLSKHRINLNNPPGKKEDPDQAILSKNTGPNNNTLWFQLEDMFQLIVTPQGIEKVTIQLIDTPTKVYAIGARLFLSKVPLEVLQNWVLIQLIVTPHILGKV